MSNPIIFCTNNRHKIKHTRLIIKNNNFNINLEYSKFDDVIDIPEYQGEAEYVAIEKAKLMYSKIKLPLLTEDSSFCFNALNGLPGPYIKSFQTKIGVNGLYNMLIGFEDKRAYQQSIYTLILSENEIHTFIGRTFGSIVSPIDGDIFVPNNYNIPTRSLPFHTQLKIIPRYHALKKLNSFLNPIYN